MLIQCLVSGPTSGSRACRPDASRMTTSGARTRRAPLPRPAKFDSLPNNPTPLFSGDFTEGNPNPAAQSDKTRADRSCLPAGIDEPARQISRMAAAAGLPVRPRPAA